MMTYQSPLREPHQKKSLPCKSRNRAGGRDAMRSGMTSYELLGSKGRTQGKGSYDARTRRMSLSFAMMAGHWP